MYIKTKSNQNTGPFLKQIWISNSNGHKNCTQELNFTNRMTLFHKHDKTTGHVICQIILRFIYTMKIMYSLLLFQAIICQILDQTDHYWILMIRLIIHDLIQAWWHKYKCYVESLRPCDAHTCQRTVLVQVMACHLLSTELLLKLMLTYCHGTDCSEICTKIQKFLLKKIYSRVLSAKCPFCAGLSWSLLKLFLCSVNQFLSRLWRLQGYNNNMINH